MATCRMEPCQRIDHRLDVTIQAQILDLLMSLKDEYGLSVLFITHDFGVVAQIADKVAVMYAGRLLETGDVYDVFDHPAHGTVSWPTTSRATNRPSSSATRCCSRDMTCSSSPSANCARYVRRCSTSSKTRTVR